MVGLLVLLEPLTRAQFITATAFGYGVINSVDKPKDFIEAPLTSTLGACISGGVYALGASFVASFVPKQLKPIVGALLIGATIYEGYRRYNGYSPRQQLVRLNIDCNTSREPPSDSPAPKNR